MAKNKGPVLYPPRIFNIYKPVGMSSFSVVNHFKKNLPQGFGKIGHFGTLDPFADGILLIGIAGACRFNNQIHIDLPKTYSAVGVLGIKTLSGDKETFSDDSLFDQDVDEKLKNLTLSKLNQLVKERFIGKYLQTPPSFSATKFQGKALYKWAREGHAIEKKPVEREVFSIEITNMIDRKVYFNVKVSTGTYIRTLFEDIAQMIGTFGYLESLTRSSYGTLNLNSCLRPEDWPKITQTNDKYIYENSIRPTDILDRKKVQLTSLELKKFINGNEIPYIFDGHIKEVFVFDEEGEIIGLAEIINDKLYPRMNFPRG